MNKYKAIIYDVDGTILNTLDMNMYTLLRIIEEETGERWTIDQVLKMNLPGSRPGVSHPKRCKCYLNKCICL